jgi:hypothetical protein
MLQRRMRSTGLIAGTVLVFASSLAAARNRVWIWNAGHSIQCDAANYSDPSVECGGYVTHGKVLLFTLGVTADVSLQRLAGNADEGFHPRPPARWTAVSGRLECRRGPGKILVQCRNAHHKFSLRARSYAVS